MGNIFSRNYSQIRRNGVAHIVNNRVQNALLDRNVKKGRMILVHFPGEAFNITVIHCFLPQTLMSKKLKLNSSMMTYKIF